MICKATKDFPIETSGWNEAPWKETPGELIRHHMGNRPDHFPKVEVKTLYDNTAVFVMFRVEDRFVRAVAESDQDDVYRDSCVEFFFCPGPDLSLGYFNLEMNCGGTILFHFQPAPRKERVIIPEKHCQKIERLHSLPRIVDPEIPSPLTWTAGCRIPLDILQHYRQVLSPGPGASWRVNFYKCADSTSHPHWLTWAPVEYHKPDFHRPRSFGRLTFH